MTGSPNYPQIVADGEDFAIDTHFVCWSWSKDRLRYATGEVVCERLVPALADLIHHEAAVLAAQFDDTPMCVDLCAERLLQALASLLACSAVPRENTARLHWLTPDIARAILTYPRMEDSDVS